MVDQAKREWFAMRVAKVDKDALFQTAKQRGISASDLVLQLIRTITTSEVTADEPQRKRAA